MLQEKFDLLDGIDCLSDINISSGINRIASFIRNGNTLSASIKKSRVFKDYEVSIIEAGEKSGDFVIAFQSVYELLNTQLNHRITKFLNLIQPVGITFIGLLLIFIIISVISPLYSSLSKIG
jgi:type II secretory pathway component PulF